MKPRRIEMKKSRKMSIVAASAIIAMATLHGTSAFAKAHDGDAGKTAKPEAYVKQKNAERSPTNTPAKPVTKAVTATTAATAASVKPDTTIKPVISSGPAISSAPAVRAVPAVPASRGVPAVPAVRAVPAAPKAAVAAPVVRSMVTKPGQVSQVSPVNQPVLSVEQRRAHDQRVQTRQEGLKDQYKGQSEARAHKHGDHKHKAPKAEKTEKAPKV